MVRRTKDLNAGWCSEKVIRQSDKHFYKVNWLFGGNILAVTSVDRKDLLYQERAQDDLVIVLVVTKFVIQSLKNQETPTHKIYMIVALLNSITFSIILIRLPRNHPMTND